MNLAASLCWFPEMCQRLRKSEPALLPLRFEFAMNRLFGAGISYETSVFPGEGRRFAKRINSRRMRSSSIFAKMFSEIPLRSAYGQCDEYS